MKGKKRILVLIHHGLTPNENVEPTKFDWDRCDWVTEYDVITTLKKLKHDVLVHELDGDLQKARETIVNFNPHIVYNLMEMFDGMVTFDQNVVSYLQLLRIPFTGCNPRGLMIARDKALTKKILKYHRISCPDFLTFPRNRRVSFNRAKEFPLIVKCLNEEASYGISQASVVHSSEKLEERVKYIQKELFDDAIAEEFIEGKEYFCGVFGNYRLESLPVWELHFDKVDNPEKQFYTRSAKFNNKYRLEKGIGTRKADLPKDLEKRVQEVSKKVYKVLNLSGYARIDLRIDNKEQIYILEANPNPDISKLDDFASSAIHAKMTYPKLLNKILDLGISWHSSYFA